MEDFYNMDRRLKLLYIASELEADKEQKQAIARAKRK